MILAGPLERTLDTLDSVIRDLPFFSVIIPTYNRTESLCRCLNALSRLDYPSAAFEALIVDDGGLESIESIVEPWRDRLLIHVLKRISRSCRFMWFTLWSVLLQLVALSFVLP